MNLPVAGLSPATGIFLPLFLRWPYAGMPGCLIHWCAACEGFFTVGIAMVRLCAVLCFCLGLVALSSPVEAGQYRSVGYHRMTFLDPLDLQPMKALVFYPAIGRPHQSRFGGYRIAAGEEAKIATGRFPLLVLSHGNTGTPLALHYLATSLAREGFIVVAVLHPGDNYKDRSRLGTLSNLYGRPLHISEAITAALGDRRLAPYVNAEQVGVIGYSAGGETALILSGAQPDLQRLRDYCKERPHDLDACSTQGELIADRDDLLPEADPRVKALMLMAPLSLMFGRHALAGVQVPTLLYSGDKDQLVAIDKNADALARKLPIMPDYRLLAGAGHFVFMAPCSAEQHKQMAALCTDAEGVDREGIHRSLVAEAARFFKRALGYPEAIDGRTAAH
ncbi:Alpha/beta hydrolase family protein [compost metagenome]